MTAITVLNKGNVPTGPFTREQIAEKLRTGECSLTDMAFVAGMTQWTPLRDVLAKVDGPTLPPPAPPVAPIYVPFPAPANLAPAYSYAATMQPPPHLAFAGFWLRLVAYFIDSLILGIPLTIIFIPLLFAVGGFTMMTAALHQADPRYSADSAANAVVPVAFIFIEIAFGVVAALSGWLYFAFQESGPHQATLGKRVMNLKVTDMAGNRLSFTHATGRFFARFITGVIPFAIGYIMAGFTEYKQAMHDLIASTLVVKN